MLLIWKHWRTRLLMIAVLILGLGGCASQNLASYQSETPHLDLRSYFNGRVMAYGMFQDRSGQVVKRFTVEMDCSWVGDQGTLDERFTYADGSTQRRIWRLTRHSDGRYTGQADDVVGSAQGSVAGNAFNWSYTLRLPVGDSTYEVQFDDWMYLIDNQVMLNRATMRKFGISLGEVTLSFFKP
jgi:hypothetical protein